MVTAIIVIKGVFESCRGPGRNKWTGRNLTYVEFSQTRMLDGPVRGISSCGALALRKKRFLNRVYEVYRSNLDSKGSWDDDEDSGFLGWRTLVYLHEADKDGRQEKEYNGTWINPMRRTLLGSEGYLRAPPRKRGSVVADCVRIQEVNWTEDWAAKKTPRESAGSQSSATATSQGPSQ